MLNVEAEVLAEDTKICLPVLLPEAFIDLGGGGGGTEHADAARLAVDPVAFEGGAIGPDELAVAALGVLVVDYGVVALLVGVLAALTVVHLVLLRFLTLAEHRHQAHLAHVLQRTKLHGLEGELSVSEAQFYKGKGTP